MMEFGVEGRTLCCKDAGCHGDACLSQQAEPAPAMRRIRVNGAYDNTRNACANEGISARRGASVGRTRLEGDVGGGTTGTSGRQLPQGLDFGMRKARAAMPSARDDAPAADYDTSDGGVRARFPVAPPSESDGFVHEGFVRCHVCDAARNGRAREDETGDTFGFAVEQSSRAGRPCPLAKHKKNRGGFAAAPV